MKACALPGAAVFMSILYPQGACAVVITEAMMILAGKSALPLLSLLLIFSTQCVFVACALGY